MSLQQSVGRFILHTYAPKLQRQHVRSLSSATAATRLVRVQRSNNDLRWAIVKDPSSLGKDTNEKQEIPVSFLDADITFPTERDIAKAQKAPTETTVASLLRAPIPVFPPPAVICIGLNYMKHAYETNKPIPKVPIQLMKNPSSVTHPFHRIVIPKMAQDPPEVDYETELAIVLGKDLKDAKDPFEAEAAILGFTVANDVSARKWQGKLGGGQWSRAKSFDTFCPLGPALLLPSANVNPGDLVIQTHLNGNLLQDSKTSDMIFSVTDLLCYLSQGTTLAKGTVISTGTPSGVGYTRDPPIYLKHGDTVSVSVEGIGHLVNHVIHD